MEDVRSVYVIHSVSYSHRHIVLTCDRGNGIVWPQPVAQVNHPARPLQLPNCCRRLSRMSCSRRCWPSDIMTHPEHYVIHDSAMTRPSLLLKGSKGQQHTQPYCLPGLVLSPSQSIAQAQAASCHPSLQCLRGHQMSPALAAKTLASSPGNNLR